MESRFVSSARAPSLSSSTLAVHRGVAVEQVAIFQAGRSHRPGFAACASTIAGPRGAADPVLRSRQAIAPHGRGRFSRASRPASRSGCGRRCFRAVARSGPASSPEHHSGSGGISGSRRRSAPGRISSQRSTKARILHISVTKRMPAFTKNEIRPTRAGEILGSGRAPGLQLIQHGDERWRAQRPVPVRASRPPLAGDRNTRSSGSISARSRIAVLGHVRDHPQRRFRRADIGAPAKIFLDHVVLNCALQFRDIRALFLGHRDIKR